MSDLNDAKIIHVPDRSMVLTSNPPQYYCMAPDGTRNPCYCHPCDWPGWSDHDEWEDRKPVSRRELREALESRAPVEPPVLSREKLIEEINDKLPGRLMDLRADEYNYLVEVLADAILESLSQEASE